MVNLPLDGSNQEVELAATQAYAFPDQCQMLLNKADNSFFTNTVEERNKAFELYRRLIARLAFLKLFKSEDEDSSLVSAYKALESEWKITISPIIQLQSIRSQAENKYNRLLLGQDMFGHRPDWAPRLSFDYYQEEVNKQLQDSMNEEAVLDAYLEALKDGNATTKLASGGINSMTSNREAAEAQIKLMASTSGPLVTNAAKVATFTPLIEQKRKDIKERITHVQIHSTFNPRTILDALATVVSITPGFGSLINLAKSGYDTYKSTTMSTDFKGVNVNLNYIVDQITTCGDDLLSLSTAYEQRKDKTLSVDDPSCVKILASVANIKNIMNQFKNLIDTEYLEELSAALDDYADTILARNNAVLEYNSAIQLLVEALSNQQYYQDQAENLGEEGIQVNPNLPAIVFWLRKTLDTLRLSLMQHLNYEAAAIRFWGLQDNNPFLEPGSLPELAFLQSSQDQLRTAFQTSLEQYANSVRSAWPVKGDIGLLYQLSSDVVNDLKIPKASTTAPGQIVHSALISIPETVSPFAGRADIRLNQVRLWLFPVELDNSDGLGRKFLSIQLIHMGNERILNEQGTPFEFSHDSVYIDFEYNTVNINELPDIRNAEVRGDQQIQGDHTLGTSAGKNSIAALGPFSKWQISIRTSDTLNTGLNLKNLKEAHLEFWGTNRPLKMT